jgi:hypothetical protein
LEATKEGEQIMECIQSLAIWIALESIRERDGREKARISKQEEVFVPFNLPPVKPEPSEDAKPAVAVPASSSEVLYVGH